MKYFKKNKEYLQDLEKCLLGQNTDFSKRKTLIKCIFVNIIISALKNYKIDRKLQSRKNMFLAHISERKTFTDYKKPY